MVETRRTSERLARIKTSQSFGSNVITAASKKQKKTKIAILSTGPFAVTDNKAASSGLFTEFLKSPHFTFAIPSSSSPVSISHTPIPAASPSIGFFADTDKSSQAGLKQSTFRPQILHLDSNHPAKRSSLLAEPAKVQRHSHSVTHQSPSYHDSSTGSSADDDSTESDLDDVDEEEDGMDSQEQDLTTMASNLTIHPDISARKQRSRLLGDHLRMLQPKANTHQDHHEVTGAPVFTSGVLDQHEPLFSQYGFFAGLSSVLDVKDASPLQDPRVYFNISAPSSAFICGSQGSGKSHTLSALLENCLMKSDVSVLDNPLTGLVFHYDNFSSDLQGTPCEAAFLASSQKIKVRVLCSPTNIATTKRTYAGLGVQIEPLRINDSDLNTKRMLDLMAVSPDSGPMPLYLHAIGRILRELRITQQETGGKFNYRKFKDMVEDCDMTPAQLSPLTMRLETLESFMPVSQTRKLASKQPKQERGNDWTTKPGMLTIVDLSCPCVTSEGACALFNMCLSLFLEQQTEVGRVIALDEAHKYMNSSTEASTLTDTLLSSIRLQRHLGTRVLISTQEPTISPALLDLCSMTIVHRFTSPEWLKCLRQHLAALDSENLELDDRPETKSVNTSIQKEVFAKIVKLRVGEALLFAPSAMVEREVRNAETVSTHGEETAGTTSVEITRLGIGYLKIKIRSRLTADGGASIMAK